MRLSSDGVGLFVLSHPKKQNTTSDLLRRMGVSHSVYVNRDWPLPLQHAEWRTDRTWRPVQRDYAIRQYRAIRGHREILALSNFNITMVMEDDAVDMPPEFIEEAVQVSIQLLVGNPTAGKPAFDAVSFHGRNLSAVMPCHMYKGRQYVELQPRLVHERAQQEFLRPLWDTTQTVPKPLTLKWHEGCLMYAVNRTGRAAWVADQVITGWPCDLFLVNNINTAVLLDSPVVHNGDNSLMTERV